MPGGKPVFYTRLTLLLAFHPTESVAEANAEQVTGVQVYNTEDFYLKT